MNFLFPTLEVGGAVDTKLVPHQRLGLKANYASIIFSRIALTTRSMVLRESSLWIMFFLWLSMVWVDTKSCFAISLVVCPLLNRTSTSNSLIVIWTSVLTQSNVSLVVVVKLTPI